MGRRLVLGLALIGAVGACTGVDRGSTADGSPSQPSLGQTSTRISQHYTPTTPPTEGELCTIGEQRAVRRTEFPMQLATDALMQSTTGSSRLAAHLVLERAEISRQIALQECERVSPEMRRYLAVARRQGAGRLTHRGLDTVMRAYGSWAEALGIPGNAVKLVAAQRGCRELKKHVEVSHRVWWRWSDTERIWWVELTYDNELDRRVVGGLDGEVVVTRLSASEYGGPRPRATLGWGGSSYDEAIIAPGLSETLVVPGIDPWIHTARTGTFTVRQVQVTVGIPGVRSWWCSLPVPERS